MDIFINSFLVVMLPIIGIVVFIREGWKAALRFFGILVLPLFLIIGIAYYLFDSLSDRNLRVLGIGIAVLSLGYLLARSLVFYFNRQTAGKLVLGENKRLSYVNIILSVVYLLTGLFLFIPLLSSSEKNISGFWGASLILLAVSAIVQGMEIFEIRENGILSGANFFSWAEIELVNWDHLLRKEKLNIKMKGLGKIYQVKVPWSQHLAVADYIEQKYPS